MGRNDVTYCVCTYNSALTLEKCLRSIRSISEDPILVVDHYSTDSTVQIARRYTDMIVQENVGLGYARQLCLDRVKEGLIVFVDGDVEIIRRTFLRESVEILADDRFGAVVGMTNTQKLRLGLPASLLVIRKRDFPGKIVPEVVDGRETFFLSRRLKDLKLRVFYLPGSIVHRSQYWKYKAEWSGAWTRMLPSSKAYQILYSGFTVFLISLNSGSVVNFLISGAVFLRFLIGFTNPEKWLHMERVPGTEGERYVEGLRSGRT